MWSVIPRIMTRVQLFYWPKIWLKKWDFDKATCLPDSSHLWRSPQMWRLSQNRFYDRPNTTSSREYCMVLRNHSLFMKNTTTQFAAVIVQRKYLCGENFKVSTNVEIMSKAVEWPTNTDKFPLMVGSLAICRESEQAHKVLIIPWWKYHFWRNLQNIHIVSHNCSIIISMVPEATLDSVELRFVFVGLSQCHVLLFMD